MQTMSQRPPTSKKESQVKFQSSAVGKTISAGDPVRNDTVSPTQMKWNTQKKDQLEDSDT